MEKRLTVDVTERQYEQLLRIQLNKSLEGKKKVSLGELIRTALNEWLERNDSKVA